MKTIREQVEQQLKEVAEFTTKPSQSQLKNELIEAEIWNTAKKTNYSHNSVWHLTYEDGVSRTLRWVLGIIPYNPIDEEYEES